MFGQRRRRWTDIETALRQRFVSAGPHISLIRRLNQSYCESYSEWNLFSNSLIFVPKLRRIIMSDDKTQLK